MSIGKLYIAEKPSVAKAIYSALGGDLNNKNPKGFYSLSSGDVVTYCVGHLMELREPDYYTSDSVPRNSKGQKVWRVDELPILPNKFLYQPKEETIDQFKIIGELLSQASEVVHCGDPDDEGQLLVDLVLRYFKFDGKVYRYWSQANDESTVKKALSNLKNNNEKIYQGMADSAEARACADWLIGMNCSRAMTLRAARGGANVLIPVGRVQTPVLNLVVSNDIQIENFKPKDFYTIFLELSSNDFKFRAKVDYPETLGGLDPEGRLIEKDIALLVAKKIQDSEIIVKNFNRKSRIENQPLTFSLSDLQVEASREYGLSAKEVMDAAQSLYETHKITSYPRTSSAYLVEDQHTEASDVLSAIKNNISEFEKIIDEADTKIKSLTWNTKKADVHHGIIPLNKKYDLSKLSKTEYCIYKMISIKYIAQFYKARELMISNITLQAGEFELKASGKEIVINGWRDLIPEKNLKDQLVPNLNIGDKVELVLAEVKDSKTKPPSRFTEGSLIEAMKSIAKYVTDPEHKKILKESDGIGTEATRYSIIEELKKRGFLEPVEQKNKSYLISTKLGRGIVQALPESLKSILLTSIFQRDFKKIIDGEKTLEQFISDQKNFVKKQVEMANDGKVSISGAPKKATISDHKCPSCGSGLIKRASKNKSGFWWGCSNYPECKSTFQDYKGKPLTTK